MLIVGLNSVKDYAVKEIQINLMNNIASSDIQVRSNLGGNTRSREVRARRESSQTSSSHHQDAQRGSHRGHASREAAADESRQGGRLGQSKRASGSQQNTSLAVHEGIIDLYLQVKVRSNDEVDLVEQKQLARERERLAKIDSLTLLDYIRTSIEILMQMKFDEDKDGAKDSKPQGFNQGDNGTASEFTSTFQSLDLPPKVYEQQLQQYEGEVRNHIKVEQQLKLHIEVLQEKIDDLEREKDKFENRLEHELAAAERKFKDQKDKFAMQLEQHRLENERLQKDLRKAREYVSASIERGRQQSAHEKGNISQVKVVRINNFVQGGAGSKAIRAQAQSHSPSGLASGNSKDSSGSVKTKLKKGIKVIGQPGKSPYQNGIFNNKASTMTQQSSTSSTNNSTENQTSTKTGRQGAASAEPGESSVIVLKQSQNASGTQFQTATTQSQQTNSNQSMQQQQNLLTAVDNMKLLTAIQRIRQVNPSQSQVQQKQSSSASGKSMKIVNLKDGKKQGDLVEQQVSMPHKKVKSQVHELRGTRVPSHHQSNVNESQNLHHGDPSDGTHPKVLQQVQKNDSSAPEFQANHSNSLENSQKMLNQRQHDLSGTGNLSASLKQNSQSITISQNKQNLRPQPQRQSCVEKPKDPSASVGQSKPKVARKRDPLNSSALAKGKISETKGKYAENRSATNAQFQRSKPIQNSDQLAHDRAQIVFGRDSQGEASDDTIQRLMEQDALVSLSRDSGAMQAANQQDFIHQFQHQLHGYHSKTSNSAQFQEAANNSHMQAIENHLGSSGTQQSKQSRLSASMQSQQLQHSSHQQHLKAQEDPEKQSFKQSSVPAAARARPRSQTGQQVHAKVNSMMML